MASTSLTLLLAHGSPAAAATARIGATPAVDLTLALPLRRQAELETLVRNQSDQSSPLFHHFLTPAQFRANYGPTAAQLRAAAAAMRAAGFTITENSSQAIRIHGTPAAVTSAFGVHLNATRIGATTHFATNENVQLPKALAAIGATVVGLSNREPKRVYSRVVAKPSNRSSIRGGYWFTDLKQAYTYPSFKTGLIGKGETIGIVIDSAINPADLRNYFHHEKYVVNGGGTPIPSISIRPVIGGAPVASATDPYNPNGDGVEAALDMEQSLGSAPGAQAIVYDIPSLYDDSIIAGYIDVVEDDIVDVVSSSFGQCELDYAAAYEPNGVDMTGILAVYHSIFLQGNAEGITWLASSGDYAGLQCPSTSYYPGFLPGVFQKGASTPATDPNVVAVGGTNLVTTAPPKTGRSLTSKYVSENAYGDPLIPFDFYGLLNNGQPVDVSGGVWGSGSGPSAYYKKPSYQYLVSTGSAYRTTPDVAMQMGGCPGGIAIIIPTPPYCGYAPPLYDKAPRSFVWTLITDPDGSGYSGYIGLIGTSAASPEFAGLLAIKAQAMGSRLGNANVMIYQLAAANTALPYRFFHQGIPGYNGVVITSALTPGYSPILGVGTPYAQNFLGFPSSALAGDPQTPSNP